MDELSVLPPEGSYSKRLRARTSSLNRRQTYSTPSPVTTREDLPLRSQSIQSPNVRDPLEILAPTPRRHLLESSASQHWLHSPPLSPLSSRAASPHSTIGNSSSYRVLAHRQSFGTLPKAGTYVDNISISPIQSTSVLKSLRPKSEEQPAMGRRWLRWMHRWGFREWVIPGIIVSSTLVKFCIGLGSYSGQATPPMFGDYEAQRHWMELTVHLPTRQWYTYDLQYWGLDYPPLTAYVSWICGLIAHWIEPSWVALDRSRGIESPTSKLFMRLSVILWDALVYVPSIIMFARTWQGTRSKRTQELALLTLLFQPALLLIDFGHFQYNSVMLGFTILSINLFATGQDLWGSFFFVLSLGFKQMALYYAPAIGSYLLAKCLYLGPVEGGRLFTRLALITTLTFLAIFSPFLPPFAHFQTIVQSISRIFPFSRGLFEDKVANFWCASNVLLKWKARASRDFLVKLSTALTALGFLPAVIVLLRASVKMQVQKQNTSESQPGKSKDIPTSQQTPFLPLLPYALLISSISFFLFSFQVHEKTILLPLMPISLLLSGVSVDSTLYSWGVLANNVAVFSMWPLLKRDGLGLQYFACLLLWNHLIGHNPVKFPPKTFIQLLSTAVYAAATSLHLLELIITPPARYPDLFSVLNVLISTPVFVLVWLWSIKCAIEVSWALGGINVDARKHLTERRPSNDLPSKSMSVNIGFRQNGAKAVSLGVPQRRQWAHKDGSLNSRRDRPRDAVS